MEYKDLQKVNKTIKMTDIKGKAYAEVPQRVDAFRQLFPDGTIETDMIFCEDGVCVFKAVASNDGKVLGTGHAYEKEGSTFINKTSYIENCETSAVGRALGFIGIGSETSIASFEEVRNAQANQTQTTKGKTKQTRAQLVNKINALCDTKGITVDDLCKMVQVSSLDDLDDSRLPKAIDYLESL